jgi:heme exporter protein C
MWGTWWVWDARLTSVLILFLIYLGYIALVQSFDDEDKGLTVGRYLVLIGSINLPIIKYSVEWWNTLHQPASISRLQSPAIDPAMLPPLLLMALAFLSLFIFLAALRLETALLLKKGVQR